MLRMRGLNIQPNEIHTNKWTSRNEGTPLKYMFNVHTKIYMDKPFITLLLLLKYAK